MSMINKLVVVCDKAYTELEGPFEHTIDGWMWNVVLPLDENEYASLTSGEEHVVRDSEGWMALAFVDGEVKSFGEVQSIDEFEGEDGLYMAIQTPGKP